MKLNVKMSFTEYFEFTIEVPDGTPEDEWEDYAHDRFGSTVYKPVDSYCDVDEIEVITQ